MKKIKVLIVGAGMRGAGYAQYAKHVPEKLEIVGVAEPRDWHRENMKKEFDIPAENCFKSWEDAAAAEKFADAVLICTQDKMHLAPSLAFADKKYHILLEKPIAPSAEDCRTIIESAMQNNIIFSVCHVMRYTTYTQELKKILNAGTIGDIVTVQHLEPVGYWHMAHSFVRGNWRREDESAFILLAKSCHDMDWLRYIIDKPCEQVASFGSLKHFRPEEKPEGAADRCLDCRKEATCPYSAKKIYYKFYNEGNRHYPLDILAPEVIEESLYEALDQGPYGRCVYACDNDVCDNQTVMMQFEGGITCNFTLSAFTPVEDRHTAIFGTRGQIRGNGKTIEIYDFISEKTRTIDTSLIDHSALAGHGGGDGGIMENFVEAVGNNDPSLILSGPEVSLESHLIAFASEKARLNNSIEKIDLGLS